MFRIISGGRICRAVALAGLLLGSATSISTAFAGECPPDKVKANVRAPVDFKPIGVTDTVLATIDLGKEPIKASGHMQRVRRLVIQPGGIVPWHSHNDRPALIYVIDGEINELLRSDRAQGRRCCARNLGYGALVEKPDR